jgi:hypothetical protein
MHPVSIIPWPDDQTRPTVFLTVDTVTAFTAKAGIFTAVKRAEIQCQSPTFRDRHCGPLLVIRLLSALVG